MGFVFYPLPSFWQYLFVLIHHSIIDYAICCFKINATRTFVRLFSRVRPLGRSRVVTKTFEMRVYRSKISLNEVLLS